MPGLEGPMRTGRRLVTLLATAGLVCVALPSAAQAHPPGHERGLQKVDHIVVIYEENHSFDNLLGGWPGVDGLARDPARTPRATQVGPDAARTPWNCLLQLDVNLTSPPLSPVCSGTTPAGVAFDSHFRNRPFPIDAYIRPTDTTCPGSSRRTGSPRARACPAAAPGTWCTASTTSSTRSTAAGWTATPPAATRPG
jgi:hypothetical protein